MSDINLFENPTPDSKRDAIHVAIEPAVAGANINLWHKWIRKFNGEWFPCGEQEAHGIVNCWRSEHLSKGDVFWAMIKPGTVNGMRHHWSHPELDEETPKKPTREESREWLENYTNTHDCPSLDEILEALSGDPNYRIDDEYFHCDGRDAHGFITPEFWFHIENLTGFKTDKPGNWSCSC